MPIFHDSYIESYYILKYILFMSTDYKAWNRLYLLLNDKFNTFTGTKMNCKALKW